MFNTSFLRLFIILEGVTNCSVYKSVSILFFSSKNIELIKNINKNKNKETSLFMKLNHQFIIRLWYMATMFKHMLCMQNQNIIHWAS